MSELNIFTEETQKSILNEMKVQNGLIKIIASGWNIDSWKAVQEIVRSGGGKRYFPVGTQFNVAHSDYGTLLFDVVAHDHNPNPNDASAHTMTLLMHDVIYGTQMDNGELLFANTTGAALAAGTYNITLYKGAYNQSTSEDGTYQFTTTVAVPAGGGIKHSNMGQWRSSYSQEQVLKGTFSVYDADSNVIASNIACALGGDGTSLGTTSVAQSNIVETIGRLNSTQRSGSGSNNYKESGVRQWLNSNAAANAWWTKQTIFDLPASYAASRNGFMNGMDSDFLSIVGAVDGVTARNTIFEADGTLGGSYTLRDEFWLPSMAEIGFGKNDTITEGSVFEYYENATATERIKYDRTATTTSRLWWMRSPLPWNSNYVRSVRASGSLDSNSANDGYGVAAACTIY